MKSRASELYDRPGVLAGGERPANDERLPGDDGGLHAPPPFPSGAEDQTREPRSCSARLVRSLQARNQAPPANWPDKAE